MKTPIVLSMIVLAAFIAVEPTKATSGPEDALGFYAVPGQELAAVPVVAATLHPKLVPIEGENVRIASEPIELVAASMFDVFCNEPVGTVCIGYITEA